jgi:hypothetical protein
METPDEERRRKRVKEEEAINLSVYHEDSSIDT